jgi:hypothetical protein
MKEQQ